MFRVHAPHARHTDSDGDGQELGVVVVITHKMKQLAKLWKQACEEARVQSGEIYWSDASKNGDYMITVFDREGGLWQHLGGGEHDE